MASKLYDLRDSQALLTVPMGGDLSPVVFRKGKAIVATEEAQAALEKFLNTVMPEMYDVRDYDPSVEVSTNYVPGASQASHLVQGVMSHGGSSHFQNPVIAELDSQLAQALVSGASAVNELVAENPAVMEGAGFVENSAPAPSAPVAPAKPQLGSKK